MSFWEGREFDKIESHQFGGVSFNVNCNVHYDLDIGFGHDILIANLNKKCQ